MAETGIAHADLTGEIAFATGSVYNPQVVKLHLLRQEGPINDDTKTLCGRHRFGRHTGRERVDNDTPRCQVCFGISAGTWNDDTIGKRWAINHG